MIQENGDVIQATQCQKVLDTRIAARHAEGRSHRRGGILVFFVVQIRVVQGQLFILYVASLFAISPPQRVKLRLRA